MLKYIKYFIKYVLFRETDVVILSELSFKEGHSRFTGAGTIATFISAKM